MSIRTNRDAACKARVALDAGKGKRKVSGLAADRGVHPTMNQQGTKALLKVAAGLFDRGGKAAAAQAVCRIHCVGAKRAGDLHHKTGELPQPPLISGIKMTIRRPARRLFREHPQEPDVPMPFRHLTPALMLAACLMAAAPGAIAQQVTPFVPVLAPPAAFSFDLLADRAEALAMAPYVPTPVEQPDVLEKIDYDAHWRIRFRPEATVMAGATPVQFFHLGTYFRQPVKMFITTGNTARKVSYDPGFFDMPEGSPARALTRGTGFAGFRLMRPDLKSDWISFLGAAYFRTDGALRQYGQSARALALDTGMPTPEEFPRFTEFYIGEGADGRVVIHALMDGPRVAGAYRMQITNTEGAGQVMEIDSRLFFRAPVERLGVGPLTSMFWYSETNRYAATDWRPEVHDTDGLMMLTGAGEQIWRPLNNPGRVVTSSFSDDNPRGFGLIQRDRAFTNYEDDGVFYDRRPAVWVEPTHGWGKGAVQLVEIPTDDEIYDNIVAFWNPADKPQAGSALRFGYKLHWVDKVPVATSLAQTVATRFAHGGVPGQPRPADLTKVVIDFEGPAVKGLGQQDGVTPEVSAPPGVEVVNPYALPVVGTDRWRMIFDIRAPMGTDTVDLRAYLSRDGAPLTETWLGQLHPAQLAAYRR